MTKGWQESQKPGSDSLSGKLNSASNKEVDRSAAYGQSFGYGDIGYGPSIEETARSLKPTGERRSANFSRIVAEPSDELAAPAKDGKPPINEDSNNNLANNKSTSKNDDKSLGSNFKENLISTTFLLPGENFEIKIPQHIKDLKVSDPNFNFEIQVQTLVQKFEFEANDARELINYLSQPGGSTGITVLGRIRPPYALVNVGKDTVNYYRKAAADRRQTKVNAQREQQRLDVQRKQEFSNLRQSYVEGLGKYSSDVRNQLHQLFLSLSPGRRQNIEAKTDELYRKLESSGLNLELREAIRIAVMNQWFPTNVEKILNGKPPAPNQSRPATTPPQNNNTRPPSSNLKQPATSQPRQPAANQPRQSATNQPRQSATNQPRQPATESNNDTRWQATARSFQEQFATNYSREQIIVIQRLVGATPDGNYGEETAQKVYQWQQNHRVPNPDGLVGDITHRAMVAQLRRTKTDDVALLESSNASNAPAVTSQVTGTRTQSNTVPVPVTDSSSNAEKASLRERATPSNLNEEIDLYQTALLQEIPQISARLQAGLNSKVFNQETVTAWNRLSELMIHLYPAAKASNVDPKLSQAIADAGSRLFEGLLQQVTNTSTTDGRVGMRRLLPPALAGAGKKIAELVAQKNWNGLYQQYFEFAIAFDDWLQEGSNYRAGNETQVKADRAGTERVEYLRGMGQQLQQFKTESAGTNPMRLIADFYPQEKASEGSANHLEKIPLSLYLGQKESQFLGQTNNQWMLTQITPKNAIDVSVPKKPEETNPPQELFDKLNSPNRFPKGIIRYTLPNGAAGMVEVDGNWKLSDWLAFIGLGAGLTALTIFTLGSGTVLVSTIGYPLLYVGAAAQVGSSVANLHERSRDGTINPMQVSLDAVNIASALTGIGATTAGRFALEASQAAQTGFPYRGMMAKLATFADGWFVPLTGANVAADGATVVLMSADAYRQSQDIWKGPGEEGDKRKAMALLIAQLAVTGGLITLSLKGNIADLGGGQRLVLHTENGVPVAGSREPTGETSPATRTTEQTETTPTQQTSRTGVVDFRTTRTDLSETELKAYMAKVNYSWKQLQKKVLEEANNMKLMLQFTAYRKQVFARYEAQIKNQFNGRVEGVFIEKGEGGDFKSVIAGSEQPTSDYDATFVSPTGDKRVELEAVIEFNLRFRQEFGKESGTVFDTNVYTTGHTFSSSMGDRLNEVLAMRQLEALLNLPRTLQEAREELTALVGPARKEQAEKILKMEKDLEQRPQKITEKVNKINELRKTDPNNSKPELKIDNIDNTDELIEIQKQTNSATDQYQHELSQEKQQNSISDAGEAQLAADRDVMALLKQRRYMTDEEWTGSYQEQVLDGITDSNVKAATAARFKKADDIYKNATQELHEKIVELNRNKPPEKQVRDRNGSPETDATKIMTANEDAQLEAFNRLYERYLKGSQNIRVKLEEFQAMKSGKTQPTLSEQELTNKIDELTIELNEIQSKALYFANEAYQTRQAVEHVVLGQQLGLKVPLETDEHLISINEQFGFAMHIVTSDAELGKAFWKSSKYIDRVNDAIKTILEANKQNPNLFDPKTIKNIERMQALFDELILIKKEKGRYYEMGDDQKTTAAIAVALEKGFNITNTADLRKELLEFSAQVNSQIRNSLSAKYRTNPSSLNNQPVETKLHSSRLKNQSELVAKSSAQNLELAEFG
ncbi:peptidoglycan-binding protein [Microcoleus sp. herbarium8]|uniref:peptidoglycan-binding protein n=1 Tax=Microcoleus sp. herbarium8 TaxID=3055436 RepID=UPI002FCF25F7